MNNARQSLYDYTIGYVCASSLATLVSLTLSEKWYYVPASLTVLYILCFVLGFVMGALRRL